MQELNDITYLEEGDSCPNCKGGVLEYIRTDSCTCHISPPCSACMEAPLTCPKCYYTLEEE